MTRTPRSASICFHDLCSLYLSTDSTIWARSSRGHIWPFSSDGLMPFWVTKHTKLLNHLSPLQSYQLLNYRRQVCIHGQGPGPGLIKPELISSFQGQLTSRNCLCFQDYWVDEKCQSSQVKHFYKVMNGCWQFLKKTAARLEWDVKKTKLTMEVTHKYLFCLLSFFFLKKTIHEQFGTALEEAEENKLPCKTLQFPIL